MMFRVPVSPVVCVCLCASACVRHPLTINSLTKLCLEGFLFSVLKVSVAV